MKTTLLLLFAALGCASAAPLEKLTTLSGKSFRQCEIKRVQPDGITFTHATGAAKILFTDLSPEWRSKFGYSPAKAAAWKEEQEAEKRRQQAARRQREEELGRAVAEAEQRARIRQLGQLAQAQALLTAQAAAQQAAAPQVGTPAAATAAPSLVPVLPALGAVHVPQQRYPGHSLITRTPWYPGFSTWACPGYGWGYSPGICHPAPAPVCLPRSRSTLIIRR